MREVLTELREWWDAGESAALATVVETFNSSPRPAGASMLVGPHGTAVGSVSGGCVEGAVYEEGQGVIASATPELVHYGISDDTAYAVGLSCGGQLDVFIEKVDRETFPEFGDVADDIEAGRPVAVVTVVEHPEAGWVGRRLVVRSDSVTGALGSTRAEEAVTADVRGLLANGLTETLTYGPHGERRGEGMRVFVASYAPKPRMVVFGAIDFAAAVAEMGHFLGYAVTVCDARPVFATPARLPAADDVVVAWPHTYLRDEVEAGRIDGRTVLCVLTHDPKFDVPLLEVALKLPEVAYIGAMGSRLTHDERMARLREAGLSEAELDRLSSPIGLDLGARTPQETAVSIAAEIIALRWGGHGDRLADREGPIHA
ncbi:XdhC family protein [Knoellia sp. S7-12]|uniref:XdhC family protein n=1 Tax=Knoellia sp. S7-12 TaxID=3126698 RepID=UPI003369ADFC